MPLLRGYILMSERGLCQRDPAVANVYLTELSPRGHFRLADWADSTYDPARPEAAWEQNTRDLHNLLYGLLVGGGRVFPHFTPELVDAMGRLRGGNFPYSDRRKVPALLEAAVSGKAPPPAGGRRRRRPSQRRRRRRSSSAKRV